MSRQLLQGETLRVACFPVGVQVGEPQGRTGFSVSGVVACGKPLRVYVYLDNLFLGSPLVEVETVQLERHYAHTQGDEPDAYYRLCC